MPYYLASMHPILHFSLLTSSLILQIFFHDKFFNVPEGCVSEDVKTLYFIEGGGKYWLTG